jgi:hypothetical protein
LDGIAFQVVVSPGTINNTGSYATLLECQSSCSRQYGWICTSEGCVTGSAGNTGSFSTLSACEDYCFYGWDCVSGNCITSSFGTTGSFPNEIICLLTCSVPYWNCDPSRWMLSSSIWNKYRIIYKF